MTVPPSRLATAGDAEAIRHLQRSIADGKHWYIALLEAIGLWTGAEEVHNGRTYLYLIAGEAFDWLLLAERLCEEVDRLLPEDEKKALLFRSQPPLILTAKQFKELIGGGKYRQYLNYFYGIIVEEALILAVRGEVRKEWLNLGYNGKHYFDDEVYRRIYGDTDVVLLKRFRRAMGRPQLKSICLSELKEFTYWLFKYRLKQCDKARIASDTKKALEQLSINGLAGKLVLS